MIIKIDFASEISMNTQLKNQIVIGIATGALLPGEALPSIRQLAGDIGINMHTVNKAYQQLKAEGYLVTHKRSGVIVNTRAEMSSGDFPKNLTEVIKPLIAESICKGMSESDFLKLCQKQFHDIERGAKQ